MYIYLLSLSWNHRSIIFKRLSRGAEHDGVSVFRELKRHFLLKLPAATPASAHHRTPRRRRFFLLVSLLDLPEPLRREAKPRTEKPGVHGVLIGGRQAGPRRVESVRLRRGFVRVNLPGRRRLVHRRRGQEILTQSCVFPLSHLIISIGVAVRDDPVTARGCNFAGGLVGAPGAPGTADICPH